MQMVIDQRKEKGKIWKEVRQWVTQERIDIDKNTEKEEGNIPHHQGQKQWY